LSGKATRAIKEQRESYFKISIFIRSAHDTSYGATFAGKDRWRNKFP